jgi:transglutaminase-like putative cysteine protease
LSKAKEIIGGVTDNITKINLLFEWVRDEIPHSKDINSDIVTCTASEVLQAGTGICYAKSHLLAALLRANEIPSGFCYQVLQRDPPFEGLVLHGLNGIFVEGYNKWVRVDPRGNTVSCNAQFDIEKEQLAYSMNKGLGEFIYDTVFTDPDTNVIGVLKKFENRNEMWPYLPNKLAKDSST